MFTIEHDFDATVVTLVDEGSVHLYADVVLSAFEDCVTVAQYDDTARGQTTITLSVRQVNDLLAALNLPEGAYRLADRKP